jgi:hypothetical protein
MPTILLTLLVCPFVAPSDDLGKLGITPEVSVQNAILAYML